ncbi:MAG: HD domain-containing protein [Spirochaetes bacterium]|nr:HD domain-containing protein [Spirochaetota bacterium]
MDKRHRKASFKSAREKLPFKLHRGLGFRLMGYFINFGLVIGLLVYLLTAIVDTRSLIRELGGFIASEIQEIHDAPAKTRENAPKLPRATRDEKLHRVLTTLQKKFPSHEEGMEVFLYFRGGAGWAELSPGKGTEISAKPAAAELTARLDEAAAKKHASSLTGGDRVVFETLIAIPTHDHQGTYVVRAAVHRDAIWARIRSDKELLIGYGILLVLFSILLGTFFAGRITWTLAELSEAALRFAKGDYAYRNTVNTRDELGFLGKTLNYMAEKVDTHIGEIEYRSRAMEAMNRIDKTVLASLFDPKVMDMVAEIVAGFLRSGVVVLAVPDEAARAYRLSIYEASVPEKARLRREPLPFDALGEGESLAAHPFAEFKVSAAAPLPPWLSAFAAMEAGTLIHAPLTGSDGYQGSCFIIDEHKAGYLAGEQEAIRMLADQVGVALQNTRIHRAKEELLLEILLSLTRAIDAKSRWTGGHSGRVAAFALELGEALGLPRRELDALKMAGHLHDIGKLATPESILDKPGALTPEEYAVIKKHPEDGARIVGPVGDHAELVPGILHHHERWDGKGYPSGLRGEAIPLAARILCIADVWDAISADRPYRAGMPSQKALAFMAENAGAMFDPKILGVFLAKCVGD